MRGGKQAVRRPVIIGRLAMLLLFIFWGVIDWPPSASAQQSFNRFPPNTSVRSNRTPPHSPRVAQLSNTPSQPAPRAEELRPENGEAGAGPQQFRVPLQEPDFQNMRIKAEDGLISLVARNAPLRDVLTLLAETQGLNVVTADPLSQPISVTLERVQLNDALDAVLSIAGYTFAINKNIILVSSLNNAGTVLSPQAQGLRLEVFQLDYVMAQDVNTAITGMLSPLGQSFLINSSATENRRPRELVAVNDLPQFLDRVRQYVAQVDLPPRQVMIEVHVLQVELDDQNRHGVNLEQLFFSRNGNQLFEIQTTGFANTNPTQAFTFQFSDGNLTAFLEMLRTQTNAKTLASPRIMVLNGQQARMQVGQQLGFRVTTTTETSTTESVDFLDVGVVLEVTPRISRDGKIMMSVRPEVSSGSVSQQTGLPEQDTTELDTDILLCDHEGIMIGGLIQETDDDLQSKVPWIGDLKYIGRLFQRRATTKTRREIIFTLIPRLLPYESHYAEAAHEKYEQADTPLLHGPLHRVPRPWEPRLPDAIENPIVIRLPRVLDYEPWSRCPNCGQIFSGEECPYCVANSAASSPDVPANQFQLQRAPVDEGNRVHEQIPTPESLPLMNDKRDESQLPAPVHVSRLPPILPTNQSARTSARTRRPSQLHSPGNYQGTSNRSSLAHEATNTVLR